MADNSILTPGYSDPVEEPATTSDTVQYLERDNFLSEYETEEEKAVVRENLNIPSRDSVYDLQEVDTLISTEIRDVMLEHLNLEDPHGILPLVEDMVADMVKTDGSTPFTAPQKGIDPTSETHLTTKKYVDKLIKDHTNAEDPHNILPEVDSILEKYVKTTDVYNKSQVYTKQDIKKQAADYIRKDGTTPFTKALVGADPQIESHLATKRYVDKVMYGHKVEVDPHGFIQILNQRLSTYAKRKDVYDKTQTYSRTQLDSIINKVVDSTIDRSLTEYMNSVDDKFEDIRLLKYTKLDGSVPFRAPQSGVDAVDESDLVTLRQLTQSAEYLSEKIENKECVWRTSGPVESTVGHVEDNTPVPPTMTLQEVCDAIFYGKSICIDAPKYVIITQKCPITLCVHGSTGLIELAELYLGDELIRTFTKEDFENGCITVDSLPMTEDTVFTFKVCYTNGAVHEVDRLVKCSLPVFVGLLPKWKFGCTITMDYLILLCEEDVEGTLNRFLNYGDDLTSFTFKYKFEDADLRHPFIVIPESYPNLVTMTTTSLKFGLEAFDVVNAIPLTVPGVENDVIFKEYIYKLALSSLNQDVTFNFSNE